MIRQIIPYLDKWYGPFPLVGMTITMCVLSFYFDSIIIEFIVLLGISISIFFLIIQIVRNMIIRKWKFFFANLVILFSFVFFLICYSVSMFFVLESRPDRFADNLIIPDNIILNIPLDISKVEREKNEKYKCDFEIYESGQPGLYEYDLWISKIGKGEVYLKAYEVTKNYRLSKKRLEDASRIYVFNSTDSIVRFWKTTHFTIYEGDFGKPYAVRFELWYRQESRKKEQKLLEKIYKIEGWQR